MNAENKQINPEELEEQEADQVKEGKNQNGDVTDAVDETSEQIKEIVPHIKFGGIQNSKLILDEAYEIIHGNLLIRGGEIRGVCKIVKEAPKSTGESASWRFAEPEDKNITVGNIEIPEGTIQRTRRGKITIDLKGTIFDNDGKNSIQAGDPLEREIVGTVENSKGGYTGTIQVRPTNDPDFQAAIKTAMDEEEFENEKDAIQYYSQAEIFFKTATLCLGDNKYNNQDFVQGVHTKIPKKLRRLYNRYFDNHSPVVKKAAKLTQDHRINTKLERKRFSGKALVLTAVIASTVTDYKEDIMQYIKGNSLEKVEMPTLNFNQEKRTYNNEELPIPTVANNMESIDSYKGFITITSKQTLGAAVEEYMKANNITGGFNNKWSFINKMPKSESTTRTNDIYYIELQQANNGKWNIIQLSKQ